MLFNAGTSGTLKSVTYEAAAIEAALTLQNLEAASTDATPPNRIAVNYFTGDNTCQITATFPGTFATDSTGKPVFSATEYITLTGFANGGSASDLDSTGIVSAVLELFQEIQSAEKSQTGAANHVTIAYDSELQTATITANDMPIAFTVASDGSTKVAAVPYLS